jgi:N-[(2S)-2-amino-2-carboxyethyl]-L-glutamate dehydrogenase
VVESTRIDFVYLSEPDMIRAGVTDMAACVDCMDEMFALLHVGDYRMAGVTNDSHGAAIFFPDESPFPNMPKNTPDRRFMAMPAYLGGNFNTSGVKWYGSNIANREKGLPRSILMFTLNDTDTGAPLAHMSANLLSAYRTGAVPGVGARHLARRDSKVVGLVGPGVMARTTLAAFIVACPDIDTLKIMGRGQKGLDEFCEWVAKSYPQITEVRVVDTLEDVVRDSDLVSYCQTGVGGDPSLYPIVRREWVKPGAFMAMPSSCNIDEGMGRSDVRKVLDKPGIYEAWAHEVPKPMHNLIYSIGAKFFDLVDDGKLSKDDLEDLCAIAAGAAPGRRNDEEIIIMAVGGMAVEDVAWGTTVYRNAIALGIGVRLNLWEEPALR